MTVAIGLSTYEGIVVGADSGASISNDKREFLRVYNGCQKIFEIGPANDRFVPGESFSGCVVAFNDGGFGPISMHELVNAFYLDVVRQNPALGNVGKEFLAYVKSEWTRLIAEKQVPDKSDIPDV